MNRGATEIRINQGGDRRIHVAAAPGVIDQEHLCKQLVGLTMASEVCARWLERDVPDLGEVKLLVAEMIAVSRRALGALRY